MLTRIRYNAKEININAGKLSKALSQTKAVSLQKLNALLPEYRPLERHPSHNQPHKYLDLNINLSELRQILCKT
ncbi:hypothetical protein [Leptospira interrogans]|uniref:hypothetical protein n=1 Tax=Leptospira interrogans TaxID=173 RepID=UPI0009E568D5|nr:hypothetical protein [Leptospira interrogans]